MTACRMFPLFRLAGSLSVWKTNYCTGTFTQCERYVRSQRAEAVPDNLLPNGTLLRRQAQAAVK